MALPWLCVSVFLCMCMSNVQLNHCGPHNHGFCHDCVCVCVCGLCIHLASSLVLCAPASFLSTSTYVSVGRPRERCPCGASHSTNLLAGIWHIMEICLWSNLMYNKVFFLSYIYLYATVESILLYGSECWTLKPTLQKSLDRCYNRMLRAVLNISKSVHVTNKNLYEGIPRVRAESNIAVCPELTILFISP